MVIHMKKGFITAILIIFTAMMWLAVLTKEKDNTEEYVKSLKAQTKENEEAGLYKQNISIYRELLQYEDEEQWYVKLKEAYRALERTADFMDICDEILEKYPDNVENAKDLFKMYDEAGRGDTVISLYRNSIGKTCRNDESIKEIYEKYIYQYEYTVSGFTGAENVWDNYMLIKGEDGKYRYTYGSGTYMFEKGFDEAFLFIDDYAAVKNDGEWYFIDKEGDRYFNVPNQDYEQLQSYSEGYAVAVRNGKYGYIDYAGKEYGMEYDYATAMYNGVAAVKEGDNWYIIDSSFKKISDTAYEDIIINSVNICSRRSIIMAKRDGVYHMLDTSGNKVTEEAFEDAKMFAQDGIAAVKNNGKWGFVDMEGKLKIDYQYEDADSFSKGFAPVKIDGVYEYIYADGTIKTDLKLDEAYQLNTNGYGLVVSGDEQSVITFALCQVEE